MKEPRVDPPDTTRSHDVARAAQHTVEPSPRSVEETVARNSAIGVEENRKAEQEAALCRIKQQQLLLEKAALEQKFEITRRLRDLQASIGWTKLPFEDSDITLEVLPVVPTSKKACRVCTDVQCTLPTAVAFVLNDRNLALLEPTLEEHRVVASDAVTVVSISRYKKAHFVSAREFCVKSAHHELSISEIAGLVPRKDANERFGSGFCLGSIDASSSSIPQGIKHVRGIVHAFGYIIAPLERLPGFPSICRIVHVSHVDPKGSLPAFAVEATYGDIAKRMKKIRLLCESQNDMFMAALASGNATLSGLLSSHAAAPQSFDVKSRHAGSSDDDSSCDTPTDDARLPTARSAPSHQHQQQHILIAGALELCRRKDWRLSKTLQQCILFDASVNFSERKALKVTSSFKCNLQTISAFLADEQMHRRYETNLDSFEVLRQPTAASPSAVIYTSYKQHSRLVAARDFCVEQYSTFLSGADAVAAGLSQYSSASAFVQSSVSCEFKGPQPGFVRGKVHAFCYVAIDEAGEGKELTVHHIHCVDLGGSIPTWIVDATAGDVCKKLAKMRDLCEDRHKMHPPRAGDTTNVAEPRSTESNEAAASCANPATVSNALDSSFESCQSGDDSSFVDQSNQVSAFYDEDSKKMCGPLFTLISSSDWGPPSISSGCQVQSLCPVPFPTAEPSVKAYCVSLEICCNLSTFRNVIQAEATARAIDPSLESMRVLPSPPYATILHTTYKSRNSFFSSRDFCTMTTTRTITDEEGCEAGLFTRGIRSSAVVQASVNATDVPEQRGYIRGVVHTFGYLAIATPPEANRVRVVHVAAIDPKGSVPTALVDLAVADTCKKVTKIKQLCEEAQVSGFTEQGTERAMETVNVASLDAAIVTPALALLKERRWSAARHVGRCQIDSTTDDGRPTVRFSLEIKCSLKTLDGFLAASASLRHIDASIDGMEQRASTTFPGAVTTKTSYRASSLYPVPRETCVAQVSRAVSQEESDHFALCTKGFKSQSFVQAAVDVAELPETRGITRVNVRNTAFVATATPPDAKRIRLAFVATSDDIVFGGKKSASTPAWLPTQDSTPSIAHKLCRLASICEESEKEVALLTETMPTESLAERPAAEATSASACLPASGPSLHVDPMATVADSGASSVQQSVHPTADKQVDTGASSATAPLSVHLRTCLSLMKPDIPWRRNKVVESVLLEDANSSYFGSSRKIQRLTADFSSSLTNFAAFLADESTVRMYDPALAEFTILQSTEPVVIYTSYKQQSRLIAARDFCIESHRTVLKGKDAVATGLTQNGNATIFVQNSVSSNLKGAQSGFVRGTILTYSYIAVSEGANDDRIKVYNIVAVDPGGSIPNWVVDAAAAENCKKLAKIRALCEQRQTR